ncbi:APC family permease [Brevibacterium daeguense]|uniref:APC family permease n=1 Tax=Brevibacterium daeguense TaxID=909936 RepID=A0ABP8EF67_9MICO
MNTALKRDLGVTGIVFMVIAAAAPITVVAANFPIILMESGSVGAPLLILAATVILLLFSAGYTWMTPHVPDAGAFYSYVDRGLGRRAGRGTAAIALMSYVLLTVSMTCYLGVQAGNLLELVTGVQLPWWLVSGIMLLIVGLLGCRRIDLSAKVLGIILVLEVVAVVAIDVGVLLSGRELTAAPFNPAEALSGAPGLGLLFAFLGFFGFEATAVFRNEARDPERTVPRATYIAVTSVGVLYILSSWLVIAGIGEDQAVAAAGENPDSIVIALAGSVVAPIFADVVQVLVVTSMFACMLSFHNIVTRYLFTLGQRGVLPAGLAEVHPEHLAPSRASLWTSAVTTGVVVVSALAQLDPVTQIYTWYSGAGAVGVILMMALTSVAVLVYGSDRRSRGVRVMDAWSAAEARVASPHAVPLSAGVRWATILGAAGLSVVLAISLWNFPLMVGGMTAAVVCGAVLVCVFVLGVLAPDRAAQRGPELAAAGVERDA